MADQVRCSSCGAINVADARFCTNCGRPVGGQAMGATAPGAEWTQRSTTTLPPAGDRAAVVSPAGTRWQTRTRDRVPLAAGSFIGIGLVYAVFGLGTMAAGNSLGTAIAIGGGLGDVGAGVDAGGAAGLAGFGTALLFLGAVALVLGVLLVARPRPWVRIAAIATAVMFVLIFVLMVITALMNLSSSVPAALVFILVGLALGGLFAWIVLILLRAPMTAASSVD